MDLFRAISIHATPPSPRLAVAVMLAVGLACGDSGTEPNQMAGDDGNSTEQPGTEPDDFNLSSCSLPQAAIFDGGVARDGIPALTNPDMSALGGPGLDYISSWLEQKAAVPQFPDLRVVGLVTRSGQAIAVPHNILWWHEIVNMDVDGRRVAITYCPLTGSAIAFDGTASGTQRLGVSGLVARNNLIMFDAETETLWAQMMQEGTCGPRRGGRLQMVPMVEMRWEQWIERHPNTLVVNSNTGWDRNYDAYPYDLYEANDAFLLFPMDTPPDDRRPGKERLLGIPDGDGGLAVPWGELQELGDHAVVNEGVGGEAVVILWDGPAKTSQAYEPRTDTGPATLVVENGRFTDQETGSVWDVEGRAIEGPRAGEELMPVEEAYVAFWFAWAAFFPETELYLN